MLNVNVNHTASAGTLIRFTVSGSQRTNYVVTMMSSGTMACSCMDAAIHCRRKGIVCKHVCFLLYRVMHCENLDFFGTMKLSDDIMQRISLTAITGRALHPVSDIDKLASSLASLNFSEVKRSVRDDDECPVCYDMLSNGANLGCPDCGNAIHKACADKWLQTASTCVYCRSTVWAKYKSK